MDMSLFGKRLKECRESASISARELAEAIGVNKATIHRYEAGAFKSIKESRLQLIADYIGVSKDYLTGKTDSKIISKTFDFFIDPNDKELSTLINKLADYISTEGVLIDGKPINKDVVLSINNYLELVTELAKNKNKEG